VIKVTVLYPDSWEHEVAEGIMTITSETPVREIVTEYPGTIPLFEQAGIDYCCGGAQTLSEACARRNIAVDEMVAAIGERGQDARKPAWASLGDLCDYITDHHHAYTRQQVALVSNLLTRVQTRHGARHPELVSIGHLFAVIEAELRHHFHCEENVLFPYIAQLEKDPDSAQLPMFESIHQPVQLMLTEHDQTGEKLSLLREKTNNYQPPADACTTFRACWKAFEDLERDLHLHIHLENNILFPRALTLTQERLG
jgi:regulator of cell morphogenesis and NO signaling